MLLEITFLLFLAFLVLWFSRRGVNVVRSVLAEREQRVLAERLDWRRPRDTRVRRSRSRWFV